MRTGQVSAQQRQAFAKRLLDLRLARGWSQDDLALRIGSHQKAVSLLERGLRIPGADWLALLADALGLSMDEIWWGPGARHRRGTETVRLAS